MASALSIIRNEHRSLTAVVRSLLWLARSAACGDIQPNYEVLGLLLDYVDAFPNRFHHPREDEYLFKALRARSATIGGTLDALEAEHVRGEELTRDLRYHLLRCRFGDRAALERFAQAVDEYADFHWQHMRKEEDVVMPLAEQVLTAEDWRPIDLAFEANDDPLLGTAWKQEFERLFRQIVLAAPVPVGVGAPWPSATAT
ncbi:MAG: hemerythrin domain-containing protein [Candidatus Rokubacteria bacterium]|nr:hemerythrin domain-containing protein [Candidatus Rokubacteria bacterium]